MTVTRLLALAPGIVPIILLLAVIIWLAVLASRISGIRRTLEDTLDVANRIARRLPPDEPDTIPLPAVPPQRRRR